MGAVGQPAPALFVLAAFSRYSEALAWARQRAEAQWGTIALDSPIFEFQETDYYEASMGTEIHKCFWAFERLIDQSSLPELKLATNQWELDYAREARHVEPRPLNLDPGYVTAAKLVLASTKDHAHRVYLSQGIYAEVTLYYKNRQWQAREWTFPDYRRPEYHQFFSECRTRLRSREREEPGS
ncbi:MAG TPA: DUF4416 family protein [Pirellulales bacterium]|jgi:hypothetical protein|nr:DUF4416 family protein [Pirellulales bacterium]